MTQTPSPLPGRVVVTSDPIDPSAEREALTAGQHDVGGVCIFEGLVRDFSGSDSDSLTLEHYPGMTEKRWRPSASARASVGRSMG